MKKKEFSELTKGEKAVLLLNSGEKLSSRIDSGFDVALYSITDFFAELWYYKGSCKIVKAEAIEKEFILNNYPDLNILPQISELLMERKL